MQIDIETILIDVPNLLAVPEHQDGEVTAPIVEQ